MENQKNNSLLLLYEVRKDAFSKAKWEEPYERFFHMIHLMLTFNKTARKEGLLALEEAAGKIPLETTFYQDVQSLLAFVVEGNEPEDVTELFTSRYYAKNLQGDDAMLYFLMIYAIIRIQSGTPQHLLESLLVACLPDEAAEQYETYKKQFPRERKPTPKESLLASSPGFEEGGILVVKELLEKKIRRADAKILKKVIRERGEKDIPIALKGLSVSAKKKIFSALSENKAEELAEECEAMGPVRAIDVMAAFAELAAVFQKYQKENEACGSKITAPGKAW